MVTIGVEELVNMNEYLEFNAPRSQEEYYSENGSPESILRYTRLPGKTFGERHAERLCKEHFNMEQRIDSTHDHIKLDKKIEQKSARFGANGAGWKWQHIEMNHGFDYLLICGLDFQGFEFYITSRNRVEELIEAGVITGQGRQDENGIAQPQQAYWFTVSDFARRNRNFNDYFTHLTSEQSLIDYIENNP